MTHIFSSDRGALENVIRMTQDGSLMFGVTDEAGQWFDKYFRAELSLALKWKRCISVHSLVRHQTLVRGGEMPLSRK
jgi:hypothetical protein